MWELAAGGLLAALLGERRPSAAPAAALQVLGLGAVLAGALLFDAHTPMPGLAAILPVAGAVAFIAGGDVPILGRVWALAPGAVHGRHLLLPLPVALARHRLRPRGDRQA